MPPPPSMDQDQDRVMAWALRGVGYLFFYDTYLYDTPLERYWKMLFNGVILSPKFCTFFHDLLYLKASMSKKKNNHRKKNCHLDYCFRYTLCQFSYFSNTQVCKISDFYYDSYRKDWYTVRKVLKKSIKKCNSFLVRKCAQTNFFYLLSSLQASTSKWTVKMKKMKNMTVKSLF